MVITWRATTRPNEIHGRDEREAVIWRMARSGGEEEELGPPVRRPNESKGQESEREAPSGRVRVSG